MLGSMFIGFIVGLIATALANRGERMGCIGKMLLGMCGAWLGQLLFGKWGPLLDETALFPSIFGAIVLLVLFRRKNN